uniref:Fork-head domain-containing protein n=1 Tax=Sphaeramia orbicularis TaxID=375764 RepID=A0A673AT80_9TELE
MSATMADAVNNNKSMFSHPPGNICLHPSSSDKLFSEDTKLFSKPSLSYVALIAKVILSSPSQKLNLGSIYREMEEQFPYLRNRGPGWKNSVRHNLSVNECFVKVSRCEDGRGHYWSIHQAYLRDFQQGNFRQHRKSRRKRWNEGGYQTVAGCLAWRETSRFLGRFCDWRSKCMGWVVPRCHLQEQRQYQMCFSDLDEASRQSWNISLAWADSASWMKNCYFPGISSDLYGRYIAGRGHDSHPLTPILNTWEMNSPILKSMKEPYDCGLIIPPMQLFTIPSWCTHWYMSNELLKPLSF